MAVQRLADELSSKALLEALQREHGGFDLLHHWQQGEFHHDIVVAVKEPRALPGTILVVATNCNAGVKEVLCFDRVPDPARCGTGACPDNPEFHGDAAAGAGRGADAALVRPLQIARA